jgi:enoyl-CoA hydratase/carnithine racemase
MKDTSMSSNPHLLYTVEGHIAHITLNRPDTRNAIDEDMHLALLNILGDIRTDFQVRAVLLSANGKAFSAGGDLEEIRRLQADAHVRRSMCDVGVRLIEAIVDIPVPIVVALHGDAIGLGASIALASDIVVASKTARLADTHVKVGLVAGDGGVLTWPMSMGMNRAKRYLLTGKMLPAEKAYEFGLVSDLVDSADEALPEARAIAEDIAALAPIAVQGTKRALNELTKARSREAFHIGMAYEKESAASEDVLEALSALEERRKPVFHNR